MGALVFFGVWIALVLFEVLFGYPISQFVTHSNPIELVILGMLFLGFIGSVVGWRNFRKVRFTSLELLLVVFGHGTVLACFREILSSLQYGYASMYPLAIAVGLLIAVGFKVGCSNRDRIREDAVRVRWIVFLAGLFWPVTAIPAVAVTLVLIASDSPLRNDWGAGIAWVVLLAPVLGQLWFWAIGEAVKVDAPKEPEK